MKKDPSIIPPQGQTPPQIDAVEFLEMEIKDLPISDLKKDILRDSFTEAYETAIPLIQEAMAFVITDESTADDTKLAAEKYKQLNEVAKRVEITRKEVKDEALREGQAIDAIGRKLKDMSAPALEHLKLQKDYLKLKKEREQAELRAARTAEMQPYANFCNMYADFGVMGVTEFETVKAQAVAAKESHEKAEALRIENERLKEEKEKRDAQELAALRIEVAKTDEKIANAVEVAKVKVIEDVKKGIIEIPTQPITPPTINIPRSFPIAPTSETPTFDPFAEFILQLERLHYPTNLQGTQAEKVAQVQNQMIAIINWLKQ